jgi:hypothetical protein
MFPYRNLQVNALQSLGDVQDKQKKAKDARKTFERSVRLHEHLTKDMPQMPWLQVQGAAQKARLLIRQARDGEVEVLEEGIKELSQMPMLSGPGGEMARYSIACALAQASQHGDPASRERFAKQAVEELEKLYQSNYFKAPQIRHLDRDDELDPLRNRDDFRVFLKHFEKSAERTGTQSEKR